MTAPENQHPFDTVSLKRISQAHPRFWDRIDMAKVRAHIDMERAKNVLGKTAQ